MIKKSFEQWLFEEIEIEFGIERQKDLTTLSDWLDVEKDDAKPISEMVEELRLSLSDNVETWNEDELKMLFIAPFLLTFKLNNPPHYRIFTQRFFSLQTENVETSGRVEWFVATGKQTPKQPFFFLQEYKPEKNSGNDPLGQLLIAMVNAQKLNQNTEKPLFGCYMMGRFWFFVVLESQKYSVSRAYDATQTDDLKAISSVLEKVKVYIHRELNLPI